MTENIVPVLDRCILRNPERSLNLAASVVGGVCRLSRLQILSQKLLTTLTAQFSSVDAKIRSGAVRVIERIFENDGAYVNGRHNPTLTHKIDGERVNKEDALTRNIMESLVKLVQGKDKSLDFKQACFTCMGFCLSETKPESLRLMIQAVKAGSIFSETIDASPSQSTRQFLWILSATTRTPFEAFDATIIFGCENGERTAGDGCGRTRQRTTPAAFFD